MTAVGASAIGRALEWVSTSGLWMRLEEWLPYRVRWGIRTVVLMSDRASCQRFVGCLRGKAGQSPVAVRVRPLDGREILIRPGTADAWTIASTLLPPPRIPDGEAGEADLVLDLGANIGVSMAYFARRYTQAQIVGVELDAANAELCRANTQGWGERCQVLVGAVWDSDGTVEYSRLPTGEEVSYRASETGSAGAHEVTGVEAFSVETLLNRYGGHRRVHMKMDIEGAERRVLATGDGWADRVATLTVEVHEPYTVDECLEDLARLGFVAGRDPRVRSCDGAKPALTAVRPQARSTRRAVEPRVRAIAACPACRQTLDWTPLMAHCRNCDRNFGIEAGVPRLRLDGALPDQVVPDPGVRASKCPPWLLAAADAHVYKSRRGREAVDRFLVGLGTGGVAINVGAGNTVYGSSVVNVEIAARPSTHVVAVAEALPFRDGSCDAVILEAVLEHLPNADGALREIRRVLAPGGRVFVDVPFIQGFHEAPGDYRRFTVSGLRAELERHGFTAEAGGVSAGPASALAWILGDFLALMLSGRRGRFWRVAHPLGHLLAGPLRWIDIWLDGHPQAGVIASGVWAIGRVP